MGEMVSHGLTHIDKRLPLNRLQWAVLIVAVLLNAEAVMLGAGWERHLLNLFLGVCLSYRPTSKDEELLQRDALRGLSWSQFIETAPLLQYVDCQNPEWSWFVINFWLVAKILVTGLSFVVSLLVFQKSPSLSFLLAGTPLFIIMRSSILHDIVAFDLAIIGLFLGHGVGGLLIGIAIASKYYFAPVVVVLALRGDFMGLLGCFVILYIYAERLKKTRFWGVQKRFLIKTLTGGCRKTILNPTKHLTWRNTSRRAVIFALYLLPAWIVVNPLFGLGFACALYILAQPKYLLLLWLTIL